MGTFQVNGNISATGSIVAGTSSKTTSPGTGIHVHDLRDATITADSFGDQKINFYFDIIDSDSNWKGIIHIKGWTGNYAAWELAGNATNDTGPNNLYHRTGQGTSWSAWKTLLDSGNYTSYTVTKTGGGASGTWGIDISGNAATANHSNSTSVLNTRWITSNITTAPVAGTLVYDHNVLPSSATGLFPTSNNANAIITLNKHQGSYDSQLGFSSNGRLYYRNFNGSALNTTTEWSTIAFTSDTVAGANYATSAGNADTLDGYHYDSFAQSSHSHYNIEYQDTRDDNFTPNNAPTGLSIHLKTNGKDGLSDGGSYHPIFVMKDWGDYSGGPYGQISITANQNMWFRASTSGTSWGSWNLLLDHTNYSSYALPITGGTMTGLLNITTNGITVTIGAQNSGHVHIYSNSVVPFVFNQSVSVMGCLSIYDMNSKGCGSSFPSSPSKGQIFFKI